MGRRWRTATVVDALVAMVVLAGGAYAAVPIARHVTLVAAPETDYVITLLPYDRQNLTITNTTIETMPDLGSLYQLSQVYAVYGYEPKRSTQITSNGTLVNASSGNRVLFSSPIAFTRTSFTYKASNNNGKSTYAGIVYITSSDQIIQNSDFILSEDSWTVNAASATAASWSATSIGDVNHFIYCDTIPLVVGSRNDEIWSFQAPAKFLSNYARAYNGFLEFSLTTFAGDFTKNVRPNPKTFVEITCTTCAAGTGITLAQRNITYDGETQKFRFTLNELGVNQWKKDPHNIFITEWSSPTQCEFFSVLSAISKIAIYADITTSQESVGLDEVNLILGSSDASVSCYP